MTMNSKDRNRELLESNYGALKTLSRLAISLYNIGNNVGYLHPKLESDLDEIADSISECVNEINGNLNEEVSLKFQEGDKFFDDLGKMLLGQFDNYASDRVFDGVRTRTKEQSEKDRERVKRNMK